MIIAPVGLVDAPEGIRNYILAGAYFIQTCEEVTIRIAVAINHIFLHNRIADILGGWGRAIIRADVVVIYVGGAVFLHQVASGCVNPRIKSNGGFNIDKIVVAGKIVGKDGRLYKMPVTSGVGAGATADRIVYLGALH